MVRTVLATFFLAMIVFRAETAQAGYEDGVADYQRGDYSAAYQEFLSAAQEGNGNAAHALGLMFLTGKGVTQDNNQAIEWYRKAAELGVGLPPPPAKSP